ncbi:MAG: PAS domain S-box protein, partial [Microvirga sp.]
MYGALRPGRCVAFEADFRTGHIDLSGASADLLGVGSCPQDQFFRHVVDQDRAVIAGLFLNARTTGTAQEAEVRYERPDGTVIRLDARVCASQRENGEVVTITGLLTEIAERGTSEAHVTFQGRLLDAVEQAVIATDLDGRIVTFNRFAETLYGWPQDEVLGRQVGELTAGAEPGRSAEMMAFLATGGRWSGEFLARRRDGTTFPAFVTDSPIFNDEGLQVGIVGVSWDITVRKRAEAELQTKSKLLEATLENMDQGLIMIDAESRATVFNQRALDLLDLPPELMSRQPSLAEIQAHQILMGDSIAQDDVVSDQDPSNGFHGVPRTYERARPNGTVLEVRTVPLPDHGAVRTYTDITARRKVELELRDREERHHALVDASSALVWRATPDGSVIEATGREPSLNHELETFKGDGWLDSVHPDDKALVVATWAECRASGMPGRCEYRVRQLGGAYRWTLAKAVPLFKADGTVREWVGTLNDIHDRREAEATLRLRERSLAAIAQGVVITDATLPDDPIIYTNSAFEVLTGYSAEEAYGRNCRFLQGPETDARVSARIRSAMKAERSIRATITNHRKDGTTFINELTISPVHSDTGVTTHFVGTVSDMTERNRLNETLRLAMKAGHMVAWEHDLKTDFITRSDNARELLGIGSGTLSDFLARVHPDDQPVRARLVEDVDRDGVGTCEFRCVLPDGETMWFGCRAEKVGPGRIVGVSYDITDRKAAEDELWHTANHDYLTGLPNRSLFQQRLDQAIDRGKQNGTSVSLLLIDLDNFKDINDTLGHDAGDALLMELATRLDVLMRDGDMVARIGGDEFAVLVAEPLTLDDADHFADMVKNRMRAPFVFDGRTFVTRASVGVAGFPAHAGNPAELMKAADIALYQAKSLGRGRIVAYAPSMRLELEGRLSLAAEIRDAIRRDQVVPYYQPKVNLATGNVMGFEALARWRHPEKGLLTPQYFGSIFTDHSLAAAIGRCMMTKIARDIRQWRDDGLDPGRV